MKGKHIMEDRPSRNISRPGRIMHLIWVSAGALTIVPDTFAGGIQTLDVVEVSADSEGLIGWQERPAKGR